jgi:hypothetical protein
MTETERRRVSGRSDLHPCLKFFSFGNTGGTFTPSIRTGSSQRINEFGFFLLFLGEFAKLRQTIIGFIITVRPSVCPHGTTRLPLDGFMKFEI